jgi:MFS family permease
MLTGAILSAVPAGQFAWIGALDGMEAWRVAFLLAGLAGLPVILMLMTFREPARRGVRLSADRASLGDVGAYLRENWLLFAPFYGGFAMLVMMTYSVNAWAATYLMRQFGLQPSEVGQWQGSVGIALGTAGAFAAGYLVDLVSRRGRPGGKLMFLFIVAVLMSPATMMVFMPSPGLAILTLGFISFFMPVIGTAMVTGVQEMVPANMRGIAVALFGLFNTITGQTIGPYLVAAVGSSGPGAAAGELGYAMMKVGLPSLMAAAGLYLASYFGYRRLLAREGVLARVIRTRA